jgi:zinc/manganese transport system permease protein
MAAPFTACVLLLLLCGYLGQHVLRREIIFIDIALAQVAALWATSSLVFDFDPHSPWALLLSLVAVALASALFATTRYGCRVLPQEAVIGVVYAFTAMLALLVIDQAERDKLIRPNFPDSFFATTEVPERWLVEEYDIMTKLT